MGGGDLNLKKQWHPAKLENMQKVYEAERKHKEELRRTEVLRKEIAQERELADMRRMQEAAGFVEQRSERLDWMYTGAAAATTTTQAPTQDDEYLLGKRKATDILDGKQEPIPNSLVHKRTVVLKQKDLESKIREDPLFSIKKKQNSNATRNNYGSIEKYSSKKKFY